MKRTTIRRTLIAAALIGATGVAAAGFAHGGPGYGMMGGYGPGYGMMGGYGPGYGMMGGYGPGYGMMGGYGPGYGMMGGYGPGGYVMGPGMMWGNGAGLGAGLNLNADQRDKIAKVTEEARGKQWRLMGQMHEEQSRLFALTNSDKPDEAALSKSYKKLSELRQQMFDNSLAAQKQVDGVLTKEQREQLRADGHCDWIN